MSVPAVRLQSGPVQSTDPIGSSTAVALWCKCSSHFSLVCYRKVRQVHAETAKIVSAPRLKRGITFRVKQVPAYHMNDFKPHLPLAVTSL